MKRLIMAVAVALALATTLAPAAIARTPEPVTIVSHMDLNYPDANTGDFHATGTDRICATGDVLDTRLLINGWPSRTGHLQILVVKEFTCTDGAFTVKLQVHTYGDGTEWFTWVVMGGTGNYAGLHGSGTGTTVTNANSTQVTNTYTGSLVN